MNLVGSVNQGSKSVLHKHPLPDKNVIGREKISGECNFIYLPVRYDFQHHKIDF